MSNMLLYVQKRRRYMLETKSASILLVLNVLKDYSDENHYLTQNDIIKRIESDYDITLERKTVKKYLSLLSEMGYDIDQKTPKGGVCLLSRELDSSQIQFLVDAIFSSKNITGKQAEQLSNVLYNMVSKYQRKKYNYLYKSEDLNRNSNPTFFYNIEVINNAIEQKKMIQFHYVDYDKNGNEILRLNGYTYRVSPYFLVNNFGKYYLLANLYSHKNITTFRVDYLRDIEMIETPIINIENVNAGSKLNIYDYLNQHVYIFGDKVSFCKLQVLDDKVNSAIVDWFGKKADFQTIDGNTFVSFYCDESAFYYWCLQYGEHIEVLQPKDVVLKLANNYKLMADRYKSISENNKAMLQIPMMLNNFIFHHLSIGDIKKDNVSTELETYLKSIISKGYETEKQDDDIFIKDIENGKLTQLSISTIFSKDKAKNLVEFFSSIKENEETRYKYDKSYKIVFVEDDVVQQREKTKNINNLFINQKIIKQIEYKPTRSNVFVFKHNYQFTIKKIPETSYYFFIFEIR